MQLSDWSLFNIFSRATVCPSLLCSSWLAGGAKEAATIHCPPPLLWWRQVDDHDDLGGTLMRLGLLALLARLLRRLWYWVVMRVGGHHRPGEGVTRRLSGGRPCNWGVYFSLTHVAIIAGVGGCVCPVAGHVLRDLFCPLVPSLRSIFTSLRGVTFTLFASPLLWFVGNTLPPTLIAHAFRSLFQVCLLRSWLPVGFLVGLGAGVVCAVKRGPIFINWRPLLDWLL